MWRQGPGGGLEPLTLEGLGPSQQGNFLALAVAASGDALALSSLHAGESEEAIVWRLEAD